VDYEDEGPFYRFYQDANGVQHESYEAACVYYGADTPDQVAAEEAYWSSQEESWLAANVFFPPMEAPELPACPF
jgi:hypothetical protein